MKNVHRLAGIYAFNLRRALGTLIWVISFWACDVPTSIQVCFSPYGNCSQVIEQTIENAQQSILVQAYQFTSPPIADALVRAYNRGVTVKLLVDRSQYQAPKTQICRLIAVGIPVGIDKVPGIAHNKVMVIDDTYVLTGSFNWTVAAEKRNAENLLLIKDPKVNSLYKEEWKKRAEKAQWISAL